MDGHSTPTAPDDGRPAPASAFALSARTADPAISVVLPMHNEEGAAESLIAEIAAALAGRRYEIVAVDDASADATLTALGRAQAREPALRVLAHARNAGQSRAVRTGVLAARGEVIVTLDGDGQNDPADIPALLEALLAPTPAGGAPRMMAAGERQGRQDAASKKAASRLANDLRARLLKDGARDTGCGLKAFWRDAFLRLPYFDHCHRYLPALMKREGYDVAFVPVGHRPRVHGRSNYTNFGRAAVAMRDLMGVMWLLGRARTPESIREVEAAADCATISDVTGRDGA